MPEVARGKDGENYGLQVSRRYLSARMASHGSLMALNADLARTPPLPPTFRGSAFAFRDTKVSTPQYGTRVWEGDRGAAVRDAFMSTMGEIAEERMAGTGRDPAKQGGHPWKKTHSTSPPTGARATPAARSVYFADSPEREGGFGALAGKVGAPRSASGPRMSWAQRGPHGAAAPRDFENFRGRNGIETATGALVTPAGKQPAEAAAAHASASRSSEETETATEEETIGGGTTTEGTVHETDGTPHALPGPGADGPAQPGPPSRQGVVEPLPQSSFLYQEVRDAYALDRYSCRRVSLVDSPRADAQERAYYQLSDALQHRRGAGAEDQPRSDALRLPVPAHAGGLGPALGALHHVHEVLKKDEKIRQEDRHFDRHRARVDAHRHQELRQVRGTARHLDATKAEAARRAKLNRRLVLRNVLLEGVHLCAHEFKIDLVLLRQRAFFPHSPY